MTIWNKVVCGWQLICW